MADAGVIPNRDAAWNYGEPQEEEGYFLVAWRRGDRAVVGVRYRIGGDDGES